MSDAAARYEEVTDGLAKLLDVGDTVRKPDSRAFKALVKAVPADRAASERDEVRWALEVTLTEWSEIDASTVPSRLALRLAKLAKRSDKDFSGLVLNLYSKLLPTKQQMERRSAEEEASMTDGELLERLPKAFRVAG